jgi:hypothetical protein
MNAQGIIIDYKEASTVLQRSWIRLTQKREKGEFPIWVNLDRVEAILPTEHGARVIYPGEEYLEVTDSFDHIDELLQPVVFAV